MKKYLVTGGAGFIGSNFLYYMMDKYPSDLFVCLDKLTYAGNLITIKPLLDKEKFVFVEGDICDEKLLDELFSKYQFDYVVNFAAESHVDRSIVDPNIFIKTNVEGTLALLNACKKHHTPRFHQVSTDEVYGDLPLEDKNLKFKENNLIKPSSPYSASKASADLVVNSYYRTFNLPVTISRCSNNYGPYQYLEKLVPLMIMKALKDEPLPVYGEGINVRDWLYVKDHCIAIDLILQKGKVGEVYNIGGNNEQTNIELVKMILDILAKPYSLIKFVEDRPGHDLRYAIDASKIINELGYKPSQDFKQNLKDTIDWYLSNSEWVKEISGKSLQDWLKKHY